MRISDWSSDVCSSDLRRAAFAGTPAGPGVLRSMKLKQNSREGVEHETAERFLRRRPAGDGVAGERDDPARSGWLLPWRGAAVPRGQRSRERRQDRKSVV